MQKKQRKNSGFTLMEMMVVIIIISIVAGIGIPTYFRAVKNAKIKERDAMVELIFDAVKVYRLEYGNYPACSGTDNCNDVLNLNIPDNWEYSVDDTSGSEKVCAKDYDTSANKEPDYFLAF